MITWFWKLLFTVIICDFGGYQLFPMDKSEWHLFQLETWWWHFVASLWLLVVWMSFNMNLFRLNEFWHEIIFFICKQNQTLQITPDSGQMWSIWLFFTWEAGAWGSLLLQWTVKWIISVQQLSPNPALPLQDNFHAGSAKYKTAFWNI